MRIAIGRYSQTHLKRVFVPTSVRSALTVLTQYWATSVQIVVVDLFLDQSDRQRIGKEATFSEMTQQVPMSSTGQLTLTLMRNSQQC